MSVCSSKCCVNQKKNKNEIITKLSDHKEIVKPPEWLRRNITTPLHTAKGGSMFGTNFLNA